MHHEAIQILKYVQNVLGYPEEFVLKSPTGPEVIIRGKKVLMFGSYNYLNLANNDFVKERAIKYIINYGVGTGGVRLLTGTMDIHKVLENKISELTNQEDSMTISSGYSTNSGVIPGLINLLGFGKAIKARKAVILNDQFNHASIIDGSHLSIAEIVKYNHCDVEDLEMKLKKYKHYRKLIVTDGIFSMDGNIAPLKKIIDLAKKYDALTMVDDAHSFGVLGKNGAGTADHLNIPGQVDINMGTFSKGIGVSGGFVSGSKRLINYLRVSTRSYMFSDSISPAIVGAVDAALDFIKQHPKIITDLKEKSDYLRNKLHQLSISTFESNTHIIPICTGDMETTIKVSQELFKGGIVCPAIRWPAVPKNLGRIRISVCSGHTYDHINKLLEVISNVLKKVTLPSR